MQPFEEIVTAYGPMVLRVCRAVVGPVDAEDAWSETFLAALKAYPEQPPDTNVEAWLVRIAHRKAIDLTRARARHPIAVESVPERGISPPEPDPELWDALAALPEKQRAAVAYHHVGGLAYKDVAAILGGTAAAARRAASDGIRSLRQALNLREEDNDELTIRSS
ncbi:RNA polymerase sigma factor [Actinocrispum wychmicini]|uniref:RNA polymerase sigma factor (Sigma-70 family) n=1 Tax=Actinocrispum wychmicini TaxID=1213861 RepID=A0A4R2JFB1_9PSEU|nr:sigma-70 family RNA polymerase sigma factor [Actinocrispum wychmicini]TCO54949.1 RNA polymerase sigma factor (sigma-70 family) [Actinocrispum wychmicini]